MGYEIVLCRVGSVDLKTKSISLDVLNSPYLKTIQTKAGEGLKFASWYAPHNHPIDAKVDKLNEVPSGYMSFPEPNDMVLVLVWLTDMSPPGKIRPNIQQNQTQEVIILSRVNWSYEELNPYDNLMLDKSGAKLHFNHGWGDTVNIEVRNPDYLEDSEEATTLQKRTGHLTLLGNRTTILSGQKFLPFGLFSHLYNRGGDTNPSIYPAGEDHGETKWKDMFTDDPTGTVYDGLLDYRKISAEKFLQPPCPPNDSYMRMHSSGDKLLIESDGHQREYITKGKVIVVGEDSSDTNVKTSFDPEGMNEISTYPDIVDYGKLSMYFLNDNDNEIQMDVDPKTDTVLITMSGGLTFDIDGIDDTVIVTTNGGTIFKIDGTSDEITMTSNTGKVLKVDGTKIYITGDLEVSGEVKGGTGIFG